MGRSRSGRPAPALDEALDVDAEDKVAHRRRTREADRAVNASPVIVRAVVLGYAGGAADLVLVAHRRAVDRRALDQLATALADPAQPVTLPEPVADAGLQGGPPDLPWGLGDPESAGRTGTIELKATAVAGDTQYVAGSDQIVVDIGDAATTMLVATPASLVYGNNLSLTATVNAPVSTSTGVSRSTSPTRPYIARQPSGASSAEGVSTPIARAESVATGPPPNSELGALTSPVQSGSTSRTSTSSGRFKITPSVPVWSWSRIKTTVRAKLGSRNVGDATRSRPE